MEFADRIGKATLSQSSQHSRQGITEARCNESQQSCIGSAATMHLDVPTLSQRDLEANKEA
jgi:hypothetical protein